eukprot:5386223-Amphidinium_carterae.1
MTSKNGVKGAEAEVKSLWEKELLMRLSAFKTEARNASRQHQAGVFLDCSKCYEQVPLAQLEQFAIERGFAVYALNCALNMYSGNRRILIQGAVSEAVQSTCGLPPGCGLA